MRRDLAAIGIALLSACAPILLCAQRPASTTLDARAVADSQAVLVLLDAQVRRNQKDAAAWYRRGVVAWALAVRADTQPSIRGLNAISLRTMADTSLRIAAGIEPTNVTYQLRAGEFLRLSMAATARLAAERFLDAALTAARADGDPKLRSRAAIELGRVQWLRYDTGDAMRTRPCRLPVSITDAGAQLMRDTDGPTEQAMKYLHNVLAGCQPPDLAYVSGDYERAEALFREALSATPDDDRAFRHVVMLLIERSRWKDLRQLASDRVTRLPADAWAWLTLGLAEHRGGSSAAASGILDSGLVRLDARARGRLFAFARLLARADAVAFAKATHEERVSREQTFWAMNDPLWSREGYDPRTEFLARVVYAEMRWTVDELDVHGADSDRGEMYIRYGPPDRVFALSMCDVNPKCQPALERLEDKIPTSIKGQQPSASGPCSSCGGDTILTFWDYDRGITLVFQSKLTYGTAYFPPADLHHVDRIEEIRAATFDNVASERIIAMASRSVRFRAPGDSVDVLVLVQAPVDSLLKAGDVATNVRADLWMFGRGLPDGYRDSAVVRPNGLERWIYRVPESEYMYRVEATADGSLVAARAVAWFTAGRDSTTGFSVHGFGVSDVLLATETQSRAATPGRWRDFSVAPVIQSLAHGAKVDLIWENYELGARGGEARYSIAITLERTTPRGGRITASILDALARVAQVERRDNRVVYRFDRTAASAPAILDHLTLDLADTPAGEYRLLLEISDRNTGRKTGNATTVIIRGQR